MTDLLQAVREPWMAAAACHGVDPELFHPGRGESQDEALAICAECSVRLECLEHALAHHEVGVWGGTSDRARKRMLAQRRRAS